MHPTAIRSFAAKTASAGSWPWTSIRAAAALHELAKEEAEALTSVADQGEKADLDQAYGVVERGRRPREYAPALRDLEKSQKARAKRRVLDVVDRGLMDLVSVYRDALALQIGASGELVNTERRDDLAVLAQSSSPEDHLRRIDAVFEAPAGRSGLQVLLGVYGYAAQIYGDFSGYTDIAIGSALLLGYQFPENFDAPYRAASPQEFWRRWHISLSSWLRDYLYVSLGGNRGGALRTYLNLFVTMVLGGLRHGAAWTFVAWGALHGGACLDLGVPARDVRALVEVDAGESAAP